MKKLFNKLFSVTLAASLFALASCQIGLGESVDIVGPSVTITDPSPRENVQGTFSVRGTAKDDTGVDSLTVTCANYTWKHTASGWVVDDGTGNGFVSDSASTWTEDLTSKKINWAVNNIDFSTQDAGDYEIIASAVDTSGNTSADSKKTRTVVVDKDAPVVSVSSPLTKTDSTYFTSITDYKDITKVSNFVTGDFTIAGSTTDDNTIKYIDVYVKSTDDSTTYYEVRLAQDQNNIPGDMAPEKYKIVDSLRAWEIDVVIANCNLKNLDANKHVLKIVTKAEDASGNVGNKSHGNFCLWKTAANPWIEVNLGSSSSSPLSVYAGSKILGNAYDDSAIKEVYATVRQGSASGAIVDDYNKKSIYTGTDENNVFFNLEVPSACAVYYVKFETNDIHDNVAAAKDGYIKVEDKTFPSVEISYKVSGTEKSNSETLFGNADGDFTFVIKATDDTNVSSLKVAYMIDDAAIVHYSDKGYSGWNNTSSSTSDLKTGKAIPITLTADGTDPATQKKKYKAELPLNIFEDLGIDGSSGHRLSNQSFVFRVEDGNGNALTKDYTILGDIDPPSIKFTNIVYDTKTFTQNENGKPLSGGTTYTNGIPAFTSSSSITVNGMIRDDAIDAWGIDTVRAKWNGAGTNLFTLTCNGNEVTPSINTTSPVNEDGKKWYKFSATVANTSAGTSLKGSSLNYKAVLRDYNNNEVTQSYAFLVDTQTLKVEYIYTSKADGCYGDTEGTVDTVIPIKIRFNKGLKFTQGTAMPYITLNNGAIATMSAVSSTGDREFVFNYTVKDGGIDEADLNVTAFKLNGGTISDSNGSVTAEAVGLINNALKPSYGINLADKKSITIIKTLPVIKENGITVTESASATTVKIQYTKDVKAGSGEVTITQKVNGMKVPPVLTKNEFNSLPTAFTDYYEYGTNGASPSFVRDLSPKYILKYEYSVDDDDLVDEYKNTGSHILKAGIKSYKTNITGDTVELTFASLPCKGASYDIVIPAGLVVDAAGGSKFPAASGSKEYTASGIETPVIRIQKTDTIIEDDFTATQPLTAKFKIDCETPGVTLGASYMQYNRRNQSKWAGDDNNGNTFSRGTDETGVPKTITNATVEQTIGDTSNKYYGQTFNITASATKNGSTVNGYEKAQRTVIRINNSSSILKLRVNSMVENDKDFGGNKKWPGRTITGNNRNSKKLGLFLKGGDNEAGPNTVAGLPATWELKEPSKSILFTEADNGFYIVSWKITCDNFYFMVAAGLMDDESKTSNGALGPMYSINAQNRWVGYYKKYPAKPGEYLYIENTNTSGDVTFEVNDAGKAQKVR